jgi:HEAT repeat protein
MDYKEALVIFSTSTEPTERRIAIEVLSEELELNEEIVNTFADGLNDEDSGVKDVCASALLKTDGFLRLIASERVAPLVKSTRIDIRNLASDLLVKLGSDAIQPLIPFLYDEDHQVRMFTCDILGLIPSHDSLPEIIKLLTDPEDNVKISAISALGNLKASNALYNLIDLYQDNEDLKLFLIEAIGKIGGASAQMFLVDKMKTETDPMLQSSCIDALAFSGDDVAICDFLLKELPVTPPEMQGILLKTIMAIAFRQEKQIDLGDSLRYVAHLALMDEDSDIRSAGLIALGYNYVEDDIPGLINESMANNPETQQFILSIILANCSTNILEMFFRRLLKSKGFEEVVEMFLLIPSVWNTSDVENKIKMVEIVADTLMRADISYSSEVIEVLLGLDEDSLSAFLFMKLNSEDRNEVELVEKFISNHSLENLV